MPVNGGFAPEAVGRALNLGGRDHSLSIRSRQNDGVINEENRPTIHLVYNYGLAWHEAQASRYDNSSINPEHLSRRTPANQRRRDRDH
jgi:hypothetical protein